VLGRRWQNQPSETADSARMNRSENSPAPLVCAYLINQYPKVSHSFVRREIMALERQGVEVHRFALRGWDERPVDPLDVEEQRRTQYLLQQGLLPLLLATLFEAFRAPRLWWRALREAVGMSRQGVRPLPYHLVYFMEACLLAASMRKRKVQHLHAHFGTNSAETAVLAALMAPCQCSFTVHGPEEFDKPEALHLRRKVELSKFVVAISSFGRSQLFRWLDAKDWGKVKVVHCGIDDAFCAGALPPVPDTPRLVCIGRLCEQKGQLLLVQAAAELKRLGITFELVLAGDGELRKPIEQLISEHGLQSSVRITGWISGRQVREELAAARAMILPSFAEGLPVVIMEAMAMERPVLSTYVAGIPELVEQGETGWLFPAGDVAAMVNVMQACLLMSQAQLQEMGRTGRSRVLARHGVDRSAGLLKQAILA
jgi:colanic acid/amylovoran biosynthesis glycosyltransferase